jgi:hypothetical protein
MRKVRREHSPIKDCVRRRLMQARAAHLINYCHRFLSNLESSHSNNICEVSADFQVASGTVDCLSDRDEKAPVGKLKTAAQI